MADNKKYYYLKLKDNFFDTDEIIVLESMADGVLYSNILLKLYLRSLKNEGRLMVNARIPYDTHMLSKVVRHPVGVVEKALGLFSDLGLIEIFGNKAIYMLDIQNYIGRSSTEADRQREYQHKISVERLVVSPKPCKESNIKPNGESNKKTTPEIEIELEIDLEIEKEKEIEKESPVPSIGECEEIQLSKYLFAFIRDNDPQKKEPNYEKWSKAFDCILRIDKRDLEEVKEIIRFCQHDSFWKSNILSPVKLREKYTALLIQMKEKSKSNKYQKEQPVEHRFDDLFYKKLLEG